MVCLCVAGGSLIQDKLDQAARLHAKGNGSGAIELYREILKESPCQPDALHMMGIIAQQGNNSELALKFFELSLAANPEHASAWYNRGLTLFVLKRNSEAVESANEALQLDPLLGDAWNLKGLILKDQNDYAKAKMCHERALALQPGNPSFYDNFALLLLAMNDFSYAYKISRQVKSLDPTYASTAICTVLNSMGYPEKALEHFGEVRSCLPKSVTTASVVTEGMTRLQIGDFEKGWELWEQRTLFPSILDEIPAWQGQKVRKLYLYEDQGMGDAIQFLRYVPLVSQRVEKITLCLREPLKTLCVENFPGVEIIEEGGAPPIDTESCARFRLASLPAFFSIHLETISSRPYLAGNDRLRAIWRERLDGLPAPRIGLVWAGGKLFKNDVARSITFAGMRPLMELGPKHFISLQKERADQKPADLYDAAPFLTDFGETAALISELDLVISVDTATAHLAGALGKPVWVLLPFCSDWRWFMGREDSPWYKSARLFRQTKPGDWGDVLERVKGALSQFLAGDAKALLPELWLGECLRQNPHAIPLPS